MLRVLVIDDEPALRDTVSRALRRAGHDTVVACDGRGGLAALSRDTFDAVVTDMYMPDSDGIELLQALHARGSTVPVLVISAGDSHSIDGLLRMATLLGAAGTLRKPFAPADLVAAVEAMAAGTSAGAA